MTARCPECGRRCAGEAELMGHMQAEHESPGYDCRRCGARFGSMEEMRSHLQRSHSYGR